MTTKTISVFTPEMLFRAKQTSTEVKPDESYEILQEYFKVIDHPLRNTKYAHMPAKSVEYGKTDQPLLNHVRNGVQWIIELNTALSKSNSPSHLSASHLREVIALFSIHDFHKTVGKEWRDQFNLTKDEVMGFVKAIHADSFAPNLSIEDFYSVAIATHPTRGYHGELSGTFHLYKDWILLADICASLEKPHVTESMRKHLAFIDKRKDFYYHTFLDSLGILTNLVHATVVEYVQPHGLIPLLYFERGVLYLGEQNAPCELTDPAQIEAIYLHLIEKIQSSHESLSLPEKLQKYIQVQGSKGLFSVEDSFFFYSGVRTVMKAFLAAAIMSRERENAGVLEVNAAEGILRLNKVVIDMQYPPADVIMIGASAIREITVDGKPRPVADVKITCHGDESRAKRYVLILDGVFIGGEKVSGTVTISGIGLMPSMVGYRHHILEDFGIDIGWDESIIPLSRAISGIRKDVIAGMIKAGSLPSDDPLVETCRLFGVSAPLTEKMVAYATSHQNQDHHSVGGFWNYAYVIARDILDRTVDGMVFSQISSIQDRLSYLYGLVDAYLDTISPEDLETYQSQILYPYKEKLLVWLCENLDLNGSMLYGAYTNKTKKFQAYCEGTGICRLTNDTPYDKERKTTSQDVSMLKYTFSNRVPIGSSEPSLYVSVPVQIELGLRSIGHGIRKGSDKIYFRLIPDYHFSTTTADLFNQFANYFDGEAKTRILDIAREFINTELPSEDSIIGLLISETGRTNLCQYTGQGFLYQNCTFDFVFNKKRNGDGEYWFFASYLALILASVTGCRIVVSETPICMTTGDEFSEFVLLEAPHVAVKRVFSDRIRLSELKNDLIIASLLISMGYEIRMDDAAFVRFLQTFRNALLPGSTLLKQIMRVYEQDKKKGGMGAFINAARGYKKINDEVVRSEQPGFIDQALMLDQFGGDEMAVVSIHELARLGLNVAIPKQFEPYRVERLFRESVKAILGLKGSNYPREDYVDAVSGRLLKMLKRAGDDQFYSTPGKSNLSDVGAFAECFVDTVFYQIARGDPGKLKRTANDLADGFYAATLKHRDAYYEARKEKNAQKSELTNEVEVSS